MNIKEHIEAGHYERDSKGRALVPTPDGQVFVCASTDAPGRFPLLGWYQESSIVAQYGADFCAVADPRRLLPPPPRKVKFTGSVKYEAGDFIVWDFATHPPCIPEEGQSFPFAGEYEEPWS